MREALVRHNANFQPQTATRAFAIAANDNVRALDRDPVPARRVKR